jgi:hypothetical protein
VKANTEYCELGDHFRTEIIELEKIFRSKK